MIRARYIEDDDREVADRVVDDSRDAPPPMPAQRPRRPRKRKLTPPVPATEAV
jgi:hypothetical protein